MLASLFTFFVLFSPGCSSPEEFEIINKYDTLSVYDVQIEYQKQIGLIRKSKSNISDLDSLGSYLHEKLTSEIFPAWYGTTWDYNGYTNYPRKGEIACGYFVSTTLKHIGFNLNRYDLAKKYSSSIVKSLCDSSSTFNDIEKMYEFINKQDDDLYVVGLSSHVGFIEKKDNEIYFIHSNYIGPVAVEKEIAIESEALNSSSVFVLGNISGNEILLEKWKNNTAFKIVD